MAKKGKCWKAAHKDEKAAKYAAFLTRQAMNIHVYPYRCQRCNLWHVGHPRTYPKVWDLLDQIAAEKKDHHK